MGLNAILALILAIVLFGGGFYLGGLREKSKYEGLEATNAQALAKAYQDQIAAQAVKAAAYEKEINDLKTSSLTQFPTVPIRLCPSPSVPKAPKAGSIVAAASGVGKADVEPVPQSQGPDYGPSLFGLADELDKVA